MVPVQAAQPGENQVKLETAGRAAQEVRPAPRAGAATPGRISTCPPLTRGPLVQVSFTLAFRIGLHMFLAPLNTLTVPSIALSQMGLRSEWPAGLRVAGSAVVLLAFVKLHYGNEGRVGHANASILENLIITALTRQGGS